MSGEKKKRHRKKLKFNAVMIWIVIEVIALIAVVGAAMFFKFYIGKTDTAKPYTNPTHTSTDVKESDIELPTNLLKGNQ